MLVHTTYFAHSIAVRNKMLILWTATRTEARINTAEISAYSRSHTYRQDTRDTSRVETHSTIIYNQAQEISTPFLLKKEEQEGEEEHVEKGGMIQQIVVSRLCMNWAPDKRYYNTNHLATKGEKERGWGDRQSQGRGKAKSSFLLLLFFISSYLESSSFFSFFLLLLLLCFLLVVIIRSFAKQKISRTETKQTWRFA